MNFETESLEKAKRYSENPMAEPEEDFMRANRFYVFTHPKILPSVRDRFEAALGGDAPADPLAARPGAGG